MASDEPPFHLSREIHFVSRTPFFSFLVVFVIKIAGERNEICCSIKYTGKILMPFRKRVADTVVAV